MAFFEKRAETRSVEQMHRFEQSTDQNHFWTTYELDQHELIKRDRRLSKTYYPKK